MTAVTDDAFTVKVGDESATDEATLVCVPVDGALPLAGADCVVAGTTVPLVLLPAALLLAPLLESLHADKLTASEQIRMQWSLEFLAKSARSYEYMM